MKRCGVFRLLVWTAIFCGLFLLITGIASAQTVMPAPSVVYVDGQAIPLESYYIGGSNYFKLRDVAYALSGSDKQFEVQYDGTSGTISIISGLPYTPVGGEMGTLGELSANATASNAKIMLNGADVVLTAYLINDNNYFMLGEIGQALGFFVSWDETAGTIHIESGDIPAAVAPDTSYTAYTYITLGDTGISPEADSVCSEFEWEVLRYTNEERMAIGLPPLATSQSMQSVADKRASELTQLFSHTRPNGELCVSVLAEYGISYHIFAENIARGHTSPYQVVQAWMNSPTGHSKNILNDKVTHMGAGYQYVSIGGYWHHWTQLFTSDETSGLSVAPIRGLGSRDAAADIDGLGLALVLQSGMLGTSYIPLTAQMCTGFDPNLPGEQLVTAHYMDRTATFSVKVHQARTAGVIAG